MNDKNQTQIFEKQALESEIFKNILKTVYVALEEKRV